VLPSEPGNLRDDLMRGRSLRWFHWLALGGVLAATLAAWRSAGQPAVLAGGALFGAMLFGAFVLQARVSRRALRYADVVAPSCGSRTRCSSTRARWRSRPTA
jgi:hypothetical protein